MRPYLARLSTSLGDDRWTSFPSERRVGLSEGGRARFRGSRAIRSISSGRRGRPPGPGSLLTFGYSPATPDGTAGPTSSGGEVIRERRGGRRRAARRRGEAEGVESVRRGGRETERGTTSARALRHARRSGGRARVPLPCDRSVSCDRDDLRSPRRVRCAELPKLRRNTRPDANTAPSGEPPRSPGSPPLASAPRAVRSSGAARRREGRRRGGARADGREARGRSSQTPKATTSSTIFTATSNSVPSRLPRRAKSARPSINI